ncbi:MAG: UDP-N-acetylmuramoyl-L-alanine--D-glutamate ligase [Candidatus Eisenbacteria bacterium]|nr:UDP-N-acetylmuramoyl-L-alanine--D-glutamate ligase [Candidatus Eisenbacteria bacterium]
MITGWADEKRSASPKQGGAAAVADDWTGRRVVVVGLARSGRAAVELLLSEGARVTATDAKPAEELAIPVDEWTSAGVRLELGGHPAGVLHGAETVVLSPGVPSDAPVVADALSRGLPVIGELELAYRLSSATWLAVTGTNGKTTTTALLGELMSRSGRRTAVAGNIGAAASGEITRVPEDGYVVAEVSSFQLDTIDTFEPRAALLLNITEDHMDRYDSFRAYAESKRRIFENQGPRDYAVLNIDDPLVAEISRLLEATVVPVSTKTEVEGGVFVRDGHMISRVRDSERTVIPVEKLGLPGPHNLANASAAAAAAIAMGVDVEAVADVLAGFRSLQHRMEPVAESGGVLYVNDSKATNVESVICALSTYDRPIVWIAGGRDKDADFGALAGLVSERVKVAVLIGEAAPKIERALRESTSFERSGSLESAVEKAAAAAAPGDVVLLSPACASFDMFRDYEDRGDRFREAVRARVSARAGAGGSGPAGEGV